MDSVGRKNLRQIHRRGVVTALAVLDAVLVTYVTWLASTL